MINYPGLFNESTALSLFLVFNSMNSLTKPMRTILAASLLSVASADADAFKLGQTVKTTSGDLTGQPSSWKPQVSEYLGIRYAEPPLGKLRFNAPVAIKAAGKAVNATKYVRIRCHYFKVITHGIGAVRNIITLTNIKLTFTVHAYQGYRQTRCHC